MKKKMLLTFAVLALTVGQATAQRVLPKMQGIAIGGGMVDGKGDSFYGSMTVDTYTKGGNKWVFGAEYLQRNHKYEYGEDGKQTISVVQITAEGGYYKQVLSDASKSFFVYVGASALAGYETVRSALPLRSSKNWNKQLLDDGSRLTGRDGFVYGCAATLNMEWYLSDKVVLTGNVRERFLRGNTTGLNHTQYGIGLKFIIN